MRTRRYRTRLLAGALAALLASGCAQSPVEPVEPSGPVVETASEETPPAPEPVYRPFPADTLYALLVAELSARRGALDVALENYLRQARATHDPGVAAQATRIARFMKNGPATLEAALIWAAAEPGSPEARYTAATELTRAGRTQEAFSQMQALRDLGEEANFTAIAASAMEGPEADRRALLGALEGLGEDPGNDVLVARAVLAQSLGDNDGALALTSRVLAAEPDNYQAVLIEAQVYQNRGDTQKAFDRIETALAAEPANQRLRLHYARQLVKTDLPKAEEQYRILVQNDPDDAELRLSLALVARELGHHADARTELEALLASGRQQDAAHFYLAEDDERAGRTDEAIAHYLAVEPSALFPPAISQAGKLLLRKGGAPALDASMQALRARWPQHASRIVLLQSEVLVEAGRYDDAWVLLSAALAQQPGDTMLLYSRSLVAEKRRDVPALERDLREIIRREPDSALALNALGYSLANLTDRHEEALALIARAHELQPEDPAILDSMGWVNYRLGRIAEALRYLRDAFARFPDHEVAAHLGEVLWVSGERDEAIATWRRGLGKTPDSPIIREAMERLGAPAAGAAP